MQRSISFLFDIDTQLIQFPAMRPIAAIVPVERQLNASFTARCFQTSSGESAIGNGKPKSRRSGQSFAKSSAAARKASDSPGTRRTTAAAREAGAKIPRDLAVLSVGNDEMVCDHVRPTLTSLAPDFEGEGYRAARELQAMMMGARPRRRVFLFGVLETVERGTTRNVSVGRAVARAARDYIAANALRGITAADVVRQLGVSRSLAGLRFREETGLSIHAAILEARLGEVKRLLSKTDKPIGEIARQVGYADANYLKNLFRRKCGCSMRQWRKEATEGQQL